MVISSFMQSPELSSFKLMKILMLQYLEQKFSVSHWSSGFWFKGLVQICSWFAFILWDGYFSILLLSLAWEHWLARYCNQTQNWAIACHVNVKRYSVNYENSSLHSLYLNVICYIHICLYLSYNFLSVHY